MGAALLACYLLTLAPSVTFWDAGEFIAAAYGLGIPHPPGTPLYVALGRVWILALSPVAGAARAMNLLSAFATALAGAITAAVVARELGTRESAASHRVWGVAAGALCAGLMATAWANATETEVYAISLLHVAVLLAAAARAAEEGEASPRGYRWLLCTAYLIALAPAVHLSALVGAPAAVVLASRRRMGQWKVSRLLLLAGVLVLAAGVGRMSAWLVVGGAALALGSDIRLRSVDRGEARSLRVSAGVLALGAVAASALLVMLLRARHDPALNQGDPATLAALMDVVARRQYDVAALLPRQAPASRPPRPRRRGRHGR